MRRHSAVSAVLVLSLITLVGCQPGGAQEGWFYTVPQQQNTWADVSDAVYGTEEHAAAIDEANPELDAPSPGVELVIPELEGEQGETVVPVGCDRKQIYR